MGLTEWGDLESSWRATTAYTHTDLAAALRQAQQSVSGYIATHEEEVAQLRGCHREEENRKRTYVQSESIGPSVPADEALESTESTEASPSPVTALLTSPPNSTELEKLYHSLCKIQAPMVRCSRPAFRKLCRMWGTDVNYTHMFLADSFTKSPHARHADFALYAGEDKLVVQLAAKSGPAVAQASVLVAPYCDAIDLNCGCPQKWAMREGLGAALLEKPELVADMVSSVRNALSGGDRVPSYGLPCVVKMRIKPGKDVRHSVDFARQCVAAGASWITVHGRTPACAPSAHVQWEAVRLIQENISVPVVANGGVVSPSGAVATALGCRVGSVMAANGLLDNPAAFHLPRGWEELRGLTFAPVHGYLGPNSFLCDGGNSLHNIVQTGVDTHLCASVVPHGWVGGGAVDAVMYSRLLWGLPATPLEVVSDFVRLAIQTDLAFPTTIQQTLRMARVYLSPTERVHLSLLRSNIAVLHELEHIGLYTDAGRVHL